MVVLVGRHLVAADDDGSGILGGHGLGLGFGQPERPARGDSPWRSASSTAGLPA
jgi:hypothetical protein